MRKQKREKERKIWEKYTQIEKKEKKIIKQFPGVSSMFFFFKEREKKTAELK